MVTIALEYMDVGSLADILKTMGKIPEVIIGLIAFQVKRERGKGKEGKGAEGFGVSA